MPTRIISLAREAGWIAAGQAAGIAGNVIGIRIVTSSIDPEAYGRIALATTVTALVVQVLLGPVLAAATRFFPPAAEAGQLPSFFRAVVGMIVVLSAALAGLAVPILTATAILAGLGWTVVGALALTLGLVSSWGSLLDTIQNAARQRSIVAWHQGLQQWLRPLAVLLLVPIFGATSEIALAGYIAAVVVVFGSQWFFFRRFAGVHAVGAPVPAQVARLRGDLIAFALPFPVWGIFSWLQFSSDRWALQSFSGTEVVGLYAVVYNLGFYPMNLLGTFVNQLVQPIVFARAGAGDEAARVASAFRLNGLMAASILVATLVAASGAALLHGPIFALLVGPQYQTASALLPFAIVSGGLITVSGLLSIFPMIIANSRALIPPRVATAVLGVALNVAGASFYGATGVFAASITTSTLLIIWLLGLMVSIRRSHLKST